MDDIAWHGATTNVTGAERAGAVGMMLCALEILDRDGHNPAAALLSLAIDQAGGQVPRPYGLEAAR